MTLKQQKPSQYTIPRSAYHGLIFLYSERSIIIISNNYNYEITCFLVKQGRVKNAFEDAELGSHEEASQDNDM